VAAVSPAHEPLKLVLPKGRIAERVLELLRAVGYAVEGTDRSYRPRCAAPNVEVKLLKPQNIPALLALGRHDVGFAGHDWVVEQGAAVEEILDTGFDAVSLVAAVPHAMRDGWQALGRPIVVATEYERLARRFVEAKKLEAVVIRTHGATEVYPPEDADMIVDNMASGETLRQNGLVVVETLLTSSTRLLAWPGVRQAAPARWERIEQLASLIRGVLLARRKVLLEMNVPRDRLDAVVKALPAMRSPTVAPLHGESGFAVKVAVDRDVVRTLVPLVKSLGASDILEYSLGKIIP
jgi:ATP phosphoribosyltransferase